MTTTSNILYKVFREQTNGDWDEIFSTRDKGKADAEAAKMSAKGTIPTKVVPFDRPPAPRIFWIC